MAVRRVLQPSASEHLAPSTIPPRVSTTGPPICKDSETGTMNGQHAEQTRPNSLGKDGPGHVTDQQLDLWEHATLLFHNYEWQAAAESFSTLRKAVGDAKEQQRCTINEGLIRARLGEVRIARDLFESAITLDKGSAIAYCALGEAEAMLGNSTKAQACYEFCLERLRGHSLVDEKRRFSYCPETAAIRRNIAALWPRTSSRIAEHSSKVGLERLPADCIFEAPPRQNSARSDLTATLDASHAQKSKKHGLKLTGQPLLQSVSEKANASATYMSLQPSKRSASILPDEIQPTSVTDRTDAVLPMRHRAGSEPQLSALPVAEGDRPTQRLTARDARIEHESLRELARFLRYSGPGVQRQCLLDRSYLLRLLEKESRAPSTIDLDQLIRPYDSSTPVVRPEFRRALTSAPDEQERTGVDVINALSLEEDHTETSVFQTAEPPCSSPKGDKSKVKPEDSPKTISSSAIFRMGGDNFF